NGSRIEIHGYKFGMDLVVDEYEGTKEPSVVFGMDFLLATKFTLNFRIGEMKINIGELQDDKDVDWLLKQMIKECGDEGVGTWEMTKMGKASLLKNKNKDSKEQNLPPPPTPTQEEPNSPDSPLLPLPNKPLQPLSPIEEAKPIESMAIKFKELLEEKPIFHVLENYTYYRKMLDEVS
ncbi:hypothetical protein Tco_0313846, partial [Tanacetum coccineum]